MTSSLDEKESNADSPSALGFILASNNVNRAAFKSGVHSGPDRDNFGLRNLSQVAQVACGDWWYLAFC